MRALILRAGFVFLCSLKFAAAAPITWEAPFNLTEASGIDLSGTLVEARNATSDGNSQTVMVGGESLLFQAIAIGPNTTNTGTFFTGGGGDTGNVQLNTVLNSHSYGSPDWSFQLNGLMPGADYQIQIFGAGDTRGCCSSRNQRAGDGESPESLSGDFSRSGVGSVIGTFTASGANQTIRLLGGIVNGTDPGISGYVLRAVAPPSPQPPTDIALSNSNLAPSTLAGTLVGVLSATDANSGDVHAYTFVDNVGFPDNDLFLISNGDELRAAVGLGSFGASYTIRLRTTDSDDLTYDKTFVLSVEAALPPTALNFSATTLLVGSPLGNVIGNFSTVDGNSADAHSYALVAGVGDGGNALFSIVGNALQVGGTLPGLGSVLSVRVRTTDLAGLSIEGVFSLTVVGASVRINEFLADNVATSLLDEDGETPDWIELHNPDGGSVSLAGWYLTDDPGNLTKWQFPEVSISGSGYRVIFASSKDRRPTNGDPLHANFSLNAGGEYVALVAPDGVTVLSEFGSGGAAYPSQRAGVTYGFYGSPLQIGFMSTPTPNAANDAGSGVLGFVADTKFSMDRGFYDTAFPLSITTATVGATIRYTTNGAWPSETSGTIYTGPIMVDRAMSVKAIAYRSGYRSTNVDTHTYVLVSSVLQQTAANTQSLYGLPATWGSQAPYYGMNNNASVNPATHPTIAEDLMVVPSVSIAIDPNEMFGASGIYSNPNSAGTAWERKTSLELIDPSDPTGGGNFQQNCAIRIQGGAFRSFGLTRKKSFRVIFKSAYGTNDLPTDGPGTLNFPLFGTDPGVAQEFQTLVFRMESNDGWQWSGANGQPQYARDEFGRRAQLALGQPASHGRYVNVYINGVYWGIYNVVERPDSGFAETYIDGAVREEWEGQNSGTPVNDASNLNAWNSYLSSVAAITAAPTVGAKDAAFLQACGFNADGTRNVAYPIWCDPSNNADYFLVNWYGGNSDWPNKNYYGGIDTRETRTGYKYFMWDSEWSLFLRSATNYNRITDYRGIAAANEGLQDSPEFRMRFGDRAHRALFNDGPLTPENALALYEEVTADHTSILVAEAARWGNQHGQSRGLADWQAEYDNIVNNWFPVRRDLFVSSLRAAGLYPSLDAPLYSQHGGSVPAGNGPMLIVPQSVGQIYYMYGGGDVDPTDFGHSLDPRLVGGGVNPAATLLTLGGGGGGVVTTNFIESGDVWRYLDDGSDQGTSWAAAGFDDSAWASGPSQLGYGDGDEATTVNFIDVDPVAGGIQKNATTYFRTTVDIPDPSVFGSFTLNYVFDDSVAIYVNGVEVVRRNLVLGAGYNVYGNGSSGDNATGTLTLASGDFVAGVNTIAAEVHQDGATSSDISFDLALTGNPPGGGGTHASAALELTEPGWLFSRSYNSSTGAWSALNTAFFSIDTVPADVTNLVISELHYQPAEPVAAGEVAVSTDRDDYEFVEVMNVGAQPIDLTGVRFTVGIAFTFADNTILPSGGRLVIVKNRLAFEERYAGILGSVSFAMDPLGSSEFTGRLSNDGEQLVLLDANDVVVRDFVYNDQLPWPTAADGVGCSLVLKAPGIPIPDHGLATSWVSSAQSGGAPGSAALFGFIGDPTADGDGDRYNALIEYALGTSDEVVGDVMARVMAGTQEFIVGVTLSDYLVVTFTRNLHAQNAVEVVPEVSSDLVDWEGDAEVVQVSAFDNGDGTETLVYRSATPMDLQEREFIRLRVTEL